MCGIVAYLGGSPALPALLDGLEQLEYRGYDSTGIALVPPGDAPLVRYRAAGRLQALRDAIGPDGEPHAAQLGIGHTRWATHGAPTAENAHPHVDCTGDIAVVHNGIIDNAAALRAELTAAGHTCTTEVDTEVIAHLLEQQFGTATRTPQALVAAIASVATRLEGSWALAVVVRGLPEIAVSSHRSPLLLAADASGDTVMAASDLLGLAPDLHDVREIADGAIVTLGRRIRWYDQHGRSVPAPRPLPVVQRSRLVPLQGAEDFTGREITEQPAVAQQLIETFTGRLAHGRLLDDLGVATPTRIRLVACGSSAYAAQVIARMITTLAKIPATVTTASEPGYDPDIPGTLTIAFSQSGETADILTALD
ncbi:MAG: SIS domain-containing protein, partial [Pseudonocardiaceae bacterium]